MIYQTGTATGVADLLEKLRVFCEAQGWTTDAYTTDGTGKRLHMNMSGVHINLRSFINEALLNGNPIYGILGNVSTSAYDSSHAWHDQPGAPVGGDGSTWHCFGGMTALSAAIPAYHFFSTGACVYVVVEYTAGKYVYMGWGQLEKIGSFTGGEFFFGSNDGVGYPYDITYNDAHLGLIGSQIDYTTGSVGFVRVDADGLLAWRFGMRNTYNIPAGRSRVFDFTNSHSPILFNSPNAINSLAILLDWVVYIYRDTANDINLSTFSPIGYIPGVYYVCLQSLVPGQEVAIASDTYLVFPFWIRKSADASPTTSTGLHGFAIKSN